MYDRIYSENDQRVTRTMNFLKIVITILVFGFFEASGIIYSLEIMDDPSSMPDNDYPN